MNGHYATFELDNRSSAVRQLDAIEGLKYAVDLLQNKVNDINLRFTPNVLKPNKPADATTVQTNKPADATTVPTNKPADATTVPTNKPADATTVQTNKPADATTVPTQLTTNYGLAMSALTNYNKYNKPVVLDTEKESAKIIRDSTGLEFLDGNIAPGGNPGYYYKHTSFFRPTTYTLMGGTRRKKRRRQRHTNKMLKMF